MLADFPDTTPQSGSLSKDVHLPATFRHELIKFITAELPRWRDDPRRPAKESETTLTSQFCAYLGDAARHANGWSCLQFRVEEPDELYGSRSIDLVASPSGAIIWIEGRSYFRYDIILPIECKRLPTPKGKKRDEREYVISRHGSTGGIQRFKAGYHGSFHELAAMIAYVQEKTAKYWDKRVKEWIEGLISSGEHSWSAKDYLNIESIDKAQRITVLHSQHTRDTGSKDIELFHLWLEMN